MSKKLLELLKDSFPRLSQVALVVERAHPSNLQVIEESRTAAQKLGVRLEILEVARADDFGTAFEAARRARADAIIVRGSGLMHRNLARLIEVEARNSFPVMHTERRFVVAGGLMSYGPDRVHPYRRAAAYVDRILKGAKPADLPVQQPIKFDLTINMKRAKAAGFEFPRSTLLRATEVIE